MQYQTLYLEKDSDIGVIILNRPEHLNTFNTTLASELNSALEELEADERIRVIIIKGNGKCFCAGIDLKDMPGESPLEYYKWVSLMEKFSYTITKIGKPVIASVHKIAVANGVGIVASADLAIAEEETKFGTTAVNVGLFCMGPAVPLARSLGRKKALELLLTGDLIDAQEAERIGLINKVVPKGCLEDATMEMARKIASKSPIAVQSGKRSFYEMADLEYKKALELTNNHFAMLCTTEDAQEGVNAFLNKRQPEWKLK